MPQFQCNNPACNNGKLLFESNLPTCPKCGNKPPVVGIATLIHLAYHATDGTIVGHLNKKVAIACNTPTHSSPFNCSTNLPYLVNCLKCKESNVFKSLWYPDPQDIMSYYDNPNLKTIDEVKKQETVAG